MTDNADTTGAAASDPAPVRPLAARNVPLVSLLLAVACIATMAYQLLRFGWLPSSSELHVMGGLSRGTVEAGNWWALGLHQLLHADVSHLVSNLFLLLVIGILVEVAWGWGITSLVMVAGAVGSAAATIVVHPTEVAVGASGIIAGLAGFGLVQYAPPRANRRALQVVSAATIALQVASYFLLRALGDEQADIVNDAAHAGGLIGGMLVALALRPKRMRAPRRLAVARRIGVSLAVVLLVASVGGSIPRYVELSGFAWRGVGFDPDPSDVPPIALVELALTGQAYAKLGTLVDPRCEVGKDDVNAVTCTSRVRNGGRRRSSFVLDRSAKHLALSPVLPPTKSRASEAFIREIPTLRVAYCDQTGSTGTRFRCRGLAGDVPVFGLLKYADDGDVSVTTDDPSSAAALVRHVGIERPGGQLRPAAVTCTARICSGVVYGHRVPIAPQLEQGVIHVEYEPDQLLGSPTTAAVVERSLRGLTVKTYFEDAVIGDIRDCVPGDEFRSWRCSVTIDDDQSSDMVLRFGLAHRFNGNGGRTDILATTYAPVPPPDLERLAARGAPSTAASIARQLRGLAFRYVDGSGSTTVTKASCTAEAFRTVEPDFTCRITFADGTTEDHGVEPSPLQSVPLDVIAAKRPKEYVTTL